MSDDTKQRNFAAELYEARESSTMGAGSAERNKP